MSRRGWLSLVLALAACRGSTSSGGSGPVPRAIAPAWAFEATQVEVVVTGDGFAPRVETDFGQQGRSTVDARFQLRLGSFALKDVSLRADGSLSATVPPLLPLGWYDLTVVDPLGREGALPRAFRVAGAADVGALVDHFRFDAIERQQAFAPFTVTLTAVDAEGRPVTSFNGSVFLTDRTGSVVPSAAGLFRGGVWTGEVEVRLPLSANALSARDDLGHTGASDEFEVAARPVAALRFATPARAVDAGRCSEAVTVELVDDFGLAAATSTELALALTPSHIAGFSLWSDPSCSSPSAPAVPAGASSATVYFKATRAGPLSLSAAAGDLHPDAQVETVRPGAAVGLAFTTPPQVINAGSCSQALTVEARDAFGNPAPADQDQAIALSAAPSAGIALFGAPGCTAPASSAVLSAGSARASFSFSGTVAMETTLTAGLGSLGPATQVERVNPEGFPTRLAFVTPPQTVPAGACSAIVRIQSQDSLGNAAAGPSDLPLALSASPSRMAFFADAGCRTPLAALAIPSGQTDAGFFFSSTLPGPISLAGESAGLSSASQIETMVAAPPAAVRFTSAPQQVPAASCSAPVTLQLRDAYGNPSAAGAPTSIALTAAPASGRGFFSDAACTTPAAAAAIAAGASGASFYFRSSAAGAFLVSLSSAGLLGDSQTETILPTEPTQLAFSTPSQAVAAGDCSGAVTVELRDAASNPSPARADTIVALAADPPAGFALFSNAGCTAPASSLSLAAGVRSGSLFFRGTLAAEVRLTATAAPLAPAVQSERILSGAADRLVFLNPPLTATAGDCSTPLTLEAQDAFGNAAPLAQAVAVALAEDPDAGLTFSAGDSCGAPASTATIDAGASRATFAFRSTRAGPHAISARAGTWAPAAQTEQVVPAAADRLAFATPRRSASVGACSTSLTVETQDPFGNASAVAAATAITLEASPDRGFRFFSDASCRGAASSVTLAAGTSSASFHFRGTVPGAVAVTATPPGLAKALQAQAVLAADAPAQLAFTTEQQRVVAGACSGPIALESRDSFGNPLAVSADTAVALAAAPAAGLAFFRDAACDSPVPSVTLAAGTRSTSFYFRGTSAGPVDLAASSAGLNGASQTEQIDPAAPDRLAFRTAPRTLVAGACSGEVEVESRDPFGNPSAPSSAAAVGFSAQPASGFTFYADAGCASAATSRPLTPAAGSVRFYFRGTVSGLVQVTAAAAGWSAATQGETIQAGPAERLAFATPARALTAGACSQVLTVEARDALGNAAPVSATMAADLSAVPAAGFAFYSDAGCTTAAAGVTIAAGSSAASFWARATAAGSRVVSAAAAGMSSAVQTETVDPAAPDRLVFTTGAQTLTAGACSPVAAVESRDAYGNVSRAAAATAVALSAAPAAGFTFYADAGCTAAASSVSLPMGSSSASFHFRGTAAGAAQVTASVAGWTPATQVEAVQAAPPSQLVFTSPARALTAGACAVQAMTVEARDPFGNPSPVATATAIALAAAPAAGFTFYPAAGCAIAGTSVSIAAGASSAAFWGIGTRAGTVQVTASASGWSPAIQSEAVGPAAPSALAFVTPAQSQIAGTCSGIATVESRDAHGNASAPAAAATLALAAAPAAGFAFFSDSACGVAVASIPLAAAATRASFYFRGTAAGSVQAVASRAGWAPASQTETIAAASPSQLFFVTSPQSIPSGTCSGAATVQSRDAYGNVSAAAASTPLALAASPASGLRFYSDPACTSSVASVPLAAGASAASFFFRGTSAGRALLTAGATGWTAASQDAWVGWLADLPYRKRIALQTARVAGDLVDFPVLVSFASDADLAARARADGRDIAFAAGDGVTQLSHEIERYDGSSGAMDAWVKAPRVSSSASTVLYLYYGDPTSADQQAASDAWDLHFRGVWHLAQNPAASAPQLRDSTSNARHGTAQGAMAAGDRVAGRIGFGLDFDGADDSVAVAGLLGAPASATISAWVNLRAADVSGGEILSAGDCIGLRVGDPALALTGFFFDGTMWQNTANPRTIAGSGWRFLAYTIDASARLQRLYVDGLQVSSTSLNFSTVWSGLGSNTVFGAHGNNKAGFRFNGALDELRFSDIPRPSTWIQTEFNNQSSPSTFYTVDAEQFSG